MNRGLTFLLCAVALLAIGVTNTQATDLDLSLNLTYTDPADPSEGGSWSLVAKTDSAIGIAAIRAIVNDVDNADLDGVGGDDSAALETDIGAIDPVATSGGPRPAILATATGVDLIYGQDISNGATTPAQVTGVGTATTSDGADSLLNPVWDGATIIATGTFSTATRPTLAAIGLDSTDGNIYTTFDDVGGTSAVAETTGNMTITDRGDSLTTLGIEGAGFGLLAGDANRDGTVGAGDVSALSGGFGTGDLWDEGNFDDVGGIGAADVSALSGNFGLSQTPIAISAVPEPSSILLVGLSCLALLGRGRRS